VKNVAVNEPAWSHIIGNEPEDFALQQKIPICSRKEVPPTRRCLFAKKFQKCVYAFGANSRCVHLAEQDLSDFVYPIVPVQALPICWLDPSQAASDREASAEEPYDLTTHTSGSAARAARRRRFTR
jgi:hypothetical protein